LAAAENSACAVVLKRREPGGGFGAAAVDAENKVLGQVSGES
jgi:hypothetical protein